MLNHWAVNNIFINYKVAYLVSLKFIYLTLLEELLSKEETIPYARTLNRVGHLRKYPNTFDTDSLDVSIVIGLARADIGGADFDMLLFAMQLYQIEMYTRDGLKHDDFS